MRPDNPLNPVDIVNLASMGFVGYTAQQREYTRIILNRILQYLLDRNRYEYWRGTDGSTINEAVYVPLFNLHPVFNDTEAFNEYQD